MKGLIIRIAKCQTAAFVLISCHILNQRHYSMLKILRRATTDKQNSKTDLSEVCGEFFKVCDNKHDLV